MIISKLEGRYPKLFPRDETRGNEPIPKGSRREAPTGSFPRVESRGNNFGYHHENLSIIILFIIREKISTLNSEFEDFLKNNPKIFGNFGNFCC